MKDFSSALNNFLCAEQFSWKAEGFFWGVEEFFYSPNRFLKEVEGFCRKLKNFARKGVLWNFSGAKELLGGTEEFIVIAKGFFWECYRISL